MSGEFRMPTTNWGGKYFGIWRNKTTGKMYDITAIGGGVRDGIVYLRARNWPDKNTMLKEEFFMERYESVPMSSDQGNSGQWSTDYEGPQKPKRYPPDGAWDVWGDT